LNDVYAAKRAQLLAALKSGGLKPIVPQGSFFIMADTSDVRCVRFGVHSVDLLHRFARQTAYTLVFA
jgi:hypothetical protein